MLTRAVVLSIAIHLAILLGAEVMVVPSDTGSIPGRPPLIASLGKAAIATSDTGQARSSRMPSQPSVLPKRRNLLTREAPAMPMDSPNAVSATRVESRAAGESGRFAAPGDEGATLAPLPVELADSVSLEGLRQYRLNLAREARRFRQYPAYARERGWEGEVVVVLSVQPGSEGPVLSLGQGSGHELLDQRALEMMKNAASRAAMPGALSGRRFRISVPVQFRLDD